MKTISLTCDNCGAPLVVPENTRHLTCSHCNSRLEVQHSGGAIFTTLLERIEKQTEQAAGHLATIKVQNELAQLDREFDMESRGEMVRDKNGRESEPSSVVSLVGGVMAVVFGLIFTFTAAQMGTGIMPLFGLLFVGMGFFIAIAGTGQTNRYAQRKSRYQRRREELLHKIQNKK